MGKSRHLGAAIALATCCVAGCASIRRDRGSEQVLAARQMAARGVEALQQGKNEQAEQLFSESLELCPVEERAHRYYGELLWERGSRQAALQHMERSAALSDGAVDVLVRLGDMQLEQGQLAEAMRWADNAVERDHRDAAAWNLRSEVLLRQGRLQESLYSCHQALNLQPEFLAVELRAARIYQQQNRHRRALSTLDVVISRYPAEQVPVEVLDQQSDCLIALNRHAAAEQRLAAAAVRAPSPDRLRRLCQLQRSMGRPRDALASIEQALALAPLDHDSQLLYHELAGNAVQQTAAVAPEQR